MKAWAALSLSVLGAAGCFVVTGGTDGYAVADAGADAGGCASMADCEGGTVCCFNASASSPGTVCRTAPCSGVLPIQLCKESTECGDAGACTKQTCSALGSTLQASICGTVAGCQR